MIACCVHNKNSNFLPISLFFSLFVKQWYKAEIKVISQGGIVDIQYSDGEMDYDLGLNNVKIFIPYSTGDMIEVLFNDQFVLARVIERLPNNTLHVRFKNLNGDMVVKESQVRRFY